MSVDLVMTVAYRDGRECVEFAPEIVVRIAGNGLDERLTDPDRARRLAAHLIEAADLLERVCAEPEVASRLSTSRARERPPPVGLGGLVVGALPPCLQD